MLTEFTRSGDEWNDRAPPLLRLQAVHAHCLSFSQLSQIKGFVVQLTAGLQRATDKELSNLSNSHSPVDHLDVLVYLSGGGVRAWVISYGSSRQGCGTWQLQEILWGFFYTINASKHITISFRDKYDTNSLHREQPLSATTVWATRANWYTVKIKTSSHIKCIEN